MPSNLAVFSDTVTVLELVAVVLSNRAVLLRRIVEMVVEAFFRRVVKGFHHSFLTLKTHFFVKQTVSPLFWSDPDEMSIYVKI